MRAIYEVYAKVVDSNGSYNTLTNYPKTFDSKNFGGDVAKTRQRAEGEFHECIGAMCKNDTRLVQSVILMDCYGNVLAHKCIGSLSEDAEA